MTVPHALITGGLGCIGAEAAKWLLRNTSAELTLVSRSASPTRIERLFFEVDRARMTFIEADVRDQARFVRILNEQRITHVLHLAALQTPDCNQHRDLGLQINLAGTQNLIEAMKACDQRLERYIFASSIAVYGPRAAYPPGLVPMLALPQPVNVYGVWKLAGEQISEFFCKDTGVPTLSLRPGVLFGPGRDAGLTSSPTTAIKSVALGMPYQIPFRSRQDYLFAPDVGAAVASALILPFDGYGIFTLPSHTLDTHQIVTALEQAAAELGMAKQCNITIGSSDVPFICDLDFQPFVKAFPDVPLTAFDVAIRESLAIFRQQAVRGWLLPDDIRR